MDYDIKIKLKDVVPEDKYNYFLFLIKVNNMDNEFISYIKSVRLYDNYNNSSNYNYLEGLKIVIIKDGHLIFNSILNEDETLNSIEFICKRI